MIELTKSWYQVQIKNIAHSWHELVRNQPYNNIQNTYSEYGRVNGMIEMLSRVFQTSTSAIRNDVAAYGKENNLNLEQL